MQSPRHSGLFSFTALPSATSLESSPFTGKRDKNKGLQTVVLWARTRGGIVTSAHNSVTELGCTPLLMSLGSESTWVPRRTKEIVG